MEGKGTGSDTELGREIRRGQQSTGTRIFLWIEIEEGSRYSGLGDERSLFEIGCWKKASYQ